MPHKPFLAPALQGMVGRVPFWQLLRLLNPVTCSRTAPAPASAFSPPPTVLYFSKNGKINTSPRILQLQIALMEHEKFI